MVSGLADVGAEGLERGPALAAVSDVGAVLLGRARLLDLVVHQPGASPWRPPGCAGSSRRPCGTPPVDGHGLSLLDPVASASPNEPANGFDAARQVGPEGDVFVVSPLIWLC